MEGINQTVPRVIKTLAELIGVEIKNNRLNIPEQFGSGYCAGFVFNAHIQLLILDYELRENLVVENSDINAASDINNAAGTILFKFQNVFPETRTLLSRSHSKEGSSVLIATRHLDPDAVISIHTNTATINIEVDADYLYGLFKTSAISPVLKGLLQNTQPLLFEEMVYPFLQEIVNAMLAETVNETFKLFFLRVKAEELICRLLMELEKRDEKRLYDLNIHDIQTMYKVRMQMLEHLDSPPVINELSAFASMSPTKLKRLFKQIFGNSIFNYYQEFRMKEAAMLLKDGKLSVSEVGYRMGFINLSHFSKVFKAHVGMRPKQYNRA
jgi:AraC-like DNA-binding protein